MQGKKQEKKTEKKTGKKLGKNTHFRIPCIAYSSFLRHERWSENASKELDTPGEENFTR